MNLRSAATQSSILLLLTGAAACGAAAGENPIRGGPVDAGKGSLTAARNYLEGRWMLESFEVFPPGKAALVLKGEGTLAYDNFGNLQMHIRTDEQSADLLRAAGIDIRDNAISNTGRTAIDLQRRTLTYLLSGQEPASVSSGPLALNRPRYWEVDANTLTLTTRDENGKPWSVGRWKRMP